MDTPESDPDVEMKHGRVEQSVFANMDDFSKEVDKLFLMPGMKISAMMQDQVTRPYVLLMIDLMNSREAPAGEIARGSVEVAASILTMMVLNLSGEPREAFVDICDKLKLVAVTLPEKNPGHHE